MYNTVPDLEASEAEPLVAAPPRKHGKAMLAVVAALAFGAGALAPSAAARVSQMKLFDIVDPSKQNPVAAGAIDCKGGETDSINCGKGKTIAAPGADPIIPVDGTPSTTEPDATPAQEPDQEPAQEPAIVNYIPGAVQSSQSTDCNKAGGSTVTVNPDCFSATVQGNANANGAAPYIPARV